MRPLTLGPAGQGLHALLHTPTAPKAGGLAVLWCNPMGQEAVRIHRFARVFGDRLARQGHHVMRFDYFGTGDSWGEDMDGDLERWRSDLLLAHQVLVDLCPGVPVVWVGCRIGATLALQCRALATPAPQRVVAWEPVLDGVAYAAELARAHRQSVELAYSRVPAAFQAAPDDEWIGFGTSLRLRQQVAEIRAAALQACDAPSVTLVLDETQRVEGFDMARQLASPSRFDWTTEEALNTALVPFDALQVLIEEAGRRA